MSKKLVLITGSSKGIGKEIARQFAKKNYKVILNGFKHERELLILQKELMVFNPDVFAYKCDVSNNEDVKKMFEDIELKIGKVDVLVNNAGVSHIGLFNTMTYDEYDGILKINLYGTINVTNSALQSMVSRKDGVIINVSSVWGQTGASCEAIYSASKGGIDVFTRSLAKELGPSKIRVNSIACGFIDTEMNNSLSEEEKEDIVQEIPLGRIGTCDDIAKLCLFLASNDSSYITGQIISVDGGWK